MNTSDFNFDLPESLIARYPLENRSASRLLVADPNNHTLTDSQFAQLADFLNPGDLIVLNNTRVIPARVYAQKPTGGKVEILIERPLENCQALAHLGSNKRVQTGQTLILPDQSEVIVLDKQDRLFILQFDPSEDFFKRLDKIGHMPLPPYLKREDTPEDLTRYQTVYAAHKGSVAAPTAGLHFDDNVFRALKEKNIDIAYLTLHVGAGTFLPVQTADVKDHIMHHEWMNLPQEVCDKVIAAKARGSRVIAVGTTSMRCLESAAAMGPLKAYTGDTNLFILPGFQFQVVDALITNFHLPESTLLMLVSAFAGVEFTQKAYQHAIDHSYRFYSYGDSSLFFKNTLL
ncbi:MAG: S-adenosylmethionine--tRNA-ribosyltransferase-isomerase [Gammaproteobacteria bacterium]|jgi:S-adenosylmethionine:tRNA ribosyltransferase-isomerase|nr:S-adenosylmethionine--tRNA-ribosyltransferase-isomerase [Gammaproteobacteria bacterium]